jgi:mRNA interferase MazF
MKRGEVWWADMPEPSASEPGFRRPVLILQSNEFNQSRISTIIAAAISSNMNLGLAPGNVTLSKKSAGLDRESVVNVSQLITLDKSFLNDRVGKISSTKMQAIEDGVRLVLAL